MPKAVLLQGLMLAGVALSVAEVAARNEMSPTIDPTSVVRVVHPELRRLVLEGHDRSATFRQLIEDLDRSGWLVFVQAGQCPEKAAVACLLHFVGAYEGKLFLRVLVQPYGRHPDNVIATLAHELQHAWEVVREPSITDAASVRAVFRRIGTVSVKSAAGIAFETAAARAAGEQVLRELDQRDRHVGVQAKRR
jgi:hypothetical protein